MKTFRTSYPLWLAYNVSKYTHVTNTRVASPFHPSGTVSRGEKCQAGWRTIHAPSVSLARGHTIARERDGASNGRGLENRRGLDTESTSWLRSRFATAFSEWLVTKQDTRTWDYAIVDDTKCIKQIVGSSVTVTSTILFCFFRKKKTVPKSFYGNLEIA